MQVNAILKRMRNSDSKGKGYYGEQAVLSIALDVANRIGGSVYHSFRFPYKSAVKGNIFLRKDGTFTTVDGEGLMDEIDVLLITPYRIIPIEVKSYKSKVLKLKDTALERDNKIHYEGVGHKNPIWQTEKHARMLYEAIYEYIPDGKAEYIKPLLCFVDRCSLYDLRDTEHKEYIPACILNNLVSFINKINTPLQYRVDVESLKGRLEKICSSQ